METSRRYRILARSVMLCAVVLIGVAGVSVSAAISELSEEVMDHITGMVVLQNYLCKGPNYGPEYCSVGCSGPYEYDDGSSVWIKCAEPHGFRYCQPALNRQCTSYDYLICSPTVDIYNGPRCIAANLIEDNSSWAACACYDCCDVAPY